jgi:hypothetical protein
MLACVSNIRMYLMYYTLPTVHIRTHDACRRTYVCHGYSAYTQYTQICTYTNIYRTMPCVQPIHIYIDISIPTNSTKNKTWKYAYGKRSFHDQPAADRTIQQSTDGWDVPDERLWTPSMSQTNAWEAHEERNSCLCIIIDMHIQSWSS